MHVKGKDYAPPSGKRIPKGPWSSPMGGGGRIGLSPFCRDIRPPRQFNGCERTRRGRNQAGRSKQERMHGLHGRGVVKMMRTAASSRLDRTCYGALLQVTAAPTKRDSGAKGTVRWSRAPHVGAPVVANIAASRCHE